MGDGRDKRRTLVPMLILAYHRVNPEVRDGLSVSPDTLRGNLEMLRENGWCNVVLEEAIAGEPHRKPERTFAVTFDDGYRDNYRYAAPVLADLGMRATVYLVSDMIDSAKPFPWVSPGPSGFDELDLHMTSQQLRDCMSDGLFTYGSHTRSHPMLSGLEEEDARAEVIGSKSRLEDQLGVEVTTFCYPAGDFNDATVDLVAEAGYSAAVVTPNRYIPETRHTMHRVGIYSHITPKLFAAKTSRFFLAAQSTRAFWSLRSLLGR